jgi:hypothetical protein
MRLPGVRLRTDLPALRLQLLPGARCVAAERDRRDSDGRLKTTLT